MAAPAPHRAPREDEPPLDPVAVERALSRHRAKRRARIEHRREQKRARLRFLVLLAFLVFAAIVLAIWVWETIEAVFGL